MEKMETVAVSELKRILTTYLAKNQKPTQLEVGNQTIDSFIVNVTPSLAESLLTRNTKNRAYSNSAVKKYTTAMEAGEWVYDGSPLTFDRNGALINGQHRLMALFKSGKTLLFKIEIGYNPEVFLTMDIGKVRSGSDILTISGVKNSGIASSTANFVFNFSRNVVGSDSNQFRNNGLLNLSHTQLVRFYNSNKSIGESIDFCLDVKKKMGRNFKSIVPFYFLTGFHFLFSQKNKEEADTFIFKFITGENLTMDSPIYVLRKRLEIAKMGEGINHANKVRLFVQSWNHFRNGKSVKVLKIPEMLPIIA